MKLLMGLMLSLAAVSGFAQTSPIRFTTGGFVQGSQQGNVLSFKGIRYAEPPIGGLRWKPPQAPIPWTDVHQATAFGHKCVQPTFDALGGVTGVEGSEDCLNLNVWTPAGAAPGSLPVLFFIHGGNYLSGSASDHAYDGAYLSEHGPAVVVTFDYRLGAFGFLAHRTMADESGQKGFGNYGALDAIAALIWVKYNIARFGGDPARVMMFGHSAGAFMSCAIMATPMARDLQLFSRVIMESGGCTVYERRSTEAMGDTLATNLGCADAQDVPACLRKADADCKAAAKCVATALKPSFLGGTAGVTYRPNIDGTFLTESPDAAFLAGTHTHVPLIITGTNAEFSRTLVPFYIENWPTNDTEYRAAVDTLKTKMDLRRATVDEVVARYPFSAWPSSLVALTTDLGLTGSRRIAREVSSSQGEPVYRGHFSGGLSGPLFLYGAFHGIDMAYVFRTFGAFKDDKPGPRELAISDAVIGYWTRFAASGDPNGAGAVNWPRFDAVTDPYLGLGPVIGSGTGLHSDNCDYWESVLY